MSDLRATVELIGSVMDDGFITPDDAVTLLVEQSDGGLTKVGAADWLIRREELGKQLDQMRDDR